MGLPSLRYGSVGQEVDKAWGPEWCQEGDFEDCIIDGISFARGGVLGGENHLIRDDSHNWALGNGSPVQATVTCMVH